MSLLSKVSGTVGNTVEHTVNKVSGTVGNTVNKVSGTLSSTAGNVIANAGQNIAPYVNGLSADAVSSLLREALENPNESLDVSVQLINPQGNPLTSLSYMAKIALLSTGLSLLGQGDQSPQASDATNNTMQKNEAQSTATLRKYAAAHPKFNQVVQQKLANLLDQLPPEDQAKAAAKQNQILSG